MNGSDDDSFNSYPEKKNLLKLIPKKDYFNFFLLKIYV